MEPDDLLAFSEGFDVEVHEAFQVVFKTIGEDDGYVFEEFLEAFDLGFLVFAEVIHDFLCVLPVAEFHEGLVEDFLGFGFDFGSKGRVFDLINEGDNELKCATELVPFAVFELDIAVLNQGLCKEHETAIQSFSFIIDITDSVDAENFEEDIRQRGDVEGVEKLEVVQEMHYHLCAVESVYFAFIITGERVRTRAANPAANLQQRVDCISQLRDRVELINHEEEELEQHFNIRSVAKDITVARWVVDVGVYANCAVLYLLACVVVLHREAEGKADDLFHQSR